MRVLLQPLDDRVKMQQHPYHRHELTISQHDRPLSVDILPPAGHRFGYSTATSIADVKEIRHSRRHLAIHGKQGRVGQRGAAIPSTIMSSESVLAPDHAAHASAAAAAAAAAAAEPSSSSSSSSSPAATAATAATGAGISAAPLDPSRAARRSVAQAPTEGAPLDPRQDVEHEQYFNKHTPLPPSGLMTFLGRLTKLGEPSMQAPAQPRSDIRGALKPRQQPRWKAMMGHHRLQTPLAFPKTEAEREEFDRQLDLWKVHNGKRWQAHEAQTRQTSFLKANNRTYVERLEYARTFYKRQQLTMRLGRWRRVVRKWRFLKKLRIKLTKICRDAFGLWAFKHRSFVKDQNRSAKAIQAWWKHSYGTRRYIRKVDFFAVVNTTVEKKNVPTTPRYNKYQVALRSIMFAYAIGMLWSMRSLEQGRFLNRIRRSLRRWHFWARKQVTCRRHNAFRARTSHGLLLGEIKRGAARSRQRRRHAAAAVIQRSLRCFNAGRTLVRLRKERDIMRRIAMRFGLSSQAALLKWSVDGWRNVLRVEKKMRSMFRKRSGDVCGKAFRAWAGEGLAQVARDKLAAAIGIQAVSRGRQARKRTEVMRRKRQFDREAAERLKRRGILAKQLGLKITDVLPGDLAANGPEKDRGVWSSSSEEDSESDSDSDFDAGAVSAGRVDEGEGNEATKGDRRGGTGQEPNLEVNAEFGQDTSVLESLVARYKLIVSERSRLDTSLSEFDRMYAEARDFLRQLHFDLKELRDVLSEVREAHAIIERRIKTVQSERAKLAKKIRAGQLTDEDTSRDFSLSRKLARLRQEQEASQRKVDLIAEQERRLQSQAAGEHRALGDETQTICRFDTAALSWNNNDRAAATGAGNTVSADSALQNVSSGPTPQRFQMRTPKQRQHLLDAMEAARKDTAKNIKAERKVLKRQSKAIRRKQRELERDCLKRLLWLAEKQGKEGCGGGDGGKTRGGVGVAARGSGGGLKFKRMLSDPNPKVTEPKVRNACLEWASMIANGWLPRHKIGTWIAGGLLDPSVPLRSRVVAFRCVREVFGEDDLLMAEVAAAVERNTLEEV
jgi:hypothetical protein